MMEWGDESGQSFLDMLVDQGVEPEALENEPRIAQCLEPYVQGFVMLSDRRAMGFSGPQPISMADMNAYMQMFPPHDPVMFVRIIGTMDTRYLKKIKDGNQDNSQ